MITSLPSVAAFQVRPSWRGPVPPQPSESPIEDRIELSSGSNPPLAPATSPRLSPAPAPAPAAPPTPSGSPRCIAILDETLPPLTRDGFLPPGIHRCSWPEFAERYGAGERRQELLANMLKLLTELAAHEDGNVFVGGSFVTAKPVPGDFDMTWRVSGSRLGELEKVAPLLVDRQEQKRTLGGELMATYPNSPGDGVLGFLQKSRSGQSIGVVEIDLSTLPRR